MKNDCIYFLVLIFILFLKYVNLYKIYIEIEKNKDIYFDVLCWFRNFLLGKLCLRELKGFEVYLVILL